MSEEIIIQALTNEIKRLNTVITTLTDLAKENYGYYQQQESLHHQYYHRFSYIYDLFKTIPLGASDINYYTESEKSWNTCEQRILDIKLQPKRKKDFIKEMNTIIEGE